MREKKVRYIEQSGSEAYSANETICGPATYHTKFDKLSQQEAAPPIIVKESRDHQKFIFSPHVPLLQDPLVMEAVRVITRVRPLSDRDIQIGSKSIVNVEKSHKEICVKLGRDSGNRSFKYDGVYAPEETNQDIFQENLTDLIQGVLEGYNATVFAYGQTGSGKSYTIHGSGLKDGNEGLVYRAVHHLFDLMQSLSENKRSIVYCSFVEIYKEEFNDLLSIKNDASRLTLREEKDNRVYVEGLQSLTAQNAEECWKFVKQGLKIRQQAATKMNADSSRSHAIFTVTVETSENVLGEDRITAGKLNFVDLAGSERQSKTDSEKERLEEAIKINLSLSTLGRVIQALTDGKATHVPYRDSKLTRLLENSLGGNAKTLMISCISPSEDNRDESLNTLAYASRAKFIKNKPVVNTDPQSALIRGLLENIRRLEEQIAAGNGPTVGSEEEQQAEIARVRHQMHENHQKEVLGLEQQQEETMKRYEVSMREASEEEKKAIIRQKDDQLRRIHEELMQRQKEEFRRLEIQKAEELRNMEESLQQTIAEERNRLMHETAEQTKKLQQAADTELVRQRKEIEEVQARDREENERLEEESRSRAELEKQKLKADFQEEMILLRRQLELEQQSQISSIVNEKEQKISELLLQKTAEIREAKDKLLAIQEVKLQQLVEQHGKIVLRLEEDRRSQDLLTKEELQHKEALQAAEIHNQIEGFRSTFKEQLIQQIQELGKNHQQVLKEKEEELQHVIKESDICCQRKLSQLTKKHRSEMEAIGKLDEGLICKNKLLQAQVYQADERNVKLQVEIDSLTRRLEDLTGEHANCADLLQDKQQKYEELEQEMAVVKKQIQKFKEKVRVLENDNMYLQTQIDQLQIDHPAYGSVVFEPQRRSSKNPGRKGHTISVRKSQASDQLHGHVLNGAASPVSPVSSAETYRVGSASSRLSRLSTATKSKQVPLVETINKSTTDSKLAEDYEVALKMKDQEIRQLKDVVKNISSSSAKSGRSSQLEVVKQRQMTQLYQEVLDLVIPFLPADRHRDVEKLLNEATWNELSGKWILPALRLTTTSEVDLNFPSLRSKMGGQSAGDHGDNSRTPRSPFAFDPHPQIEPLRLVDSPRPLSTARSNLSSSHHRRTPHPLPSVRKRELLF